MWLFKTTKHDWAGKVIHCELCKIFKFCHSDKWYMHKPASVVENEMHKILCDFAMQTDHPLISAQRLDLVLSKKKRTYHLVDFTDPVDHRVKMKGSEKMNKYLNIVRKAKKKLWNMKVTMILIVSTLGMVPQRPVKKERLMELVITGKIEIFQTTALLKLNL